MDDAELLLSLNNVSQGSRTGPWFNSTAGESWFPG